MTGQTDARFGFVIGTGRCGSTLVHEVLARHHAVAFLSNVQDSLGGVDPNGRLNDLLYRRAPVRTAGLRRFPGAPSEAYSLLDRRVSTILSRPFRDLTADDATPWLVARLRRFFSECARAQHRSLLVHKFTGWPRAGLLEQAFPGARFIHIVRDGRAFANSLLHVPWAPYSEPMISQWGRLPPTYEAEWEQSGRSFVVLAAVLWKVLIDAFADAQTKIAPGLWLEMRYEDIVADPRAGFERILTFMELEWDRRFEAWFTQYAFDGDRSDAFRSELGPADCALLVDVLAHHLARYGYA